MKETSTQNILVIGIDAAALVASAKRAGYNVFAVDYFGDQDLKQTCKDNLSIVTQKTGKSCGRLATNFSPTKLLSLAKKLRTMYQMDAALLASGLEDSPQVLIRLNELIPIIGNPPRTIEKVRDKAKFFHELKKLAIHHPETSVAKNLEEGKRAAKDIGYPVIIKPLPSLGGVGIRKVNDRSELDLVFQQTISSSKEVLIQEFVSGMNMSVSFLSSKGETEVLTLNEQLLGIQEVGQREPFGYCGNIVPASVSGIVTDACIDVAKKIVPHFSLAGSNGIDFVISKDGVPYVVEVNPRFQGTFECVERVLGINLVNAHMKACIEEKLLFHNEEKLTNCCVRLILYARQRSIAPNLSSLEKVRDIPLPRVVIEESEPLCSIIVEEKTRSSALKKSRMLTERVYGMVKPKLQ
ncbi:MAG: ATP-grasp domain-containing protein [Candidatus Bathyarchaeota archaeon]|nr:ATP-grasp domain-containing protein [Candidatus Bathyarchaeota archaeon]MDH5494123.1 ATP-grasp domain-containing protein [Candidatus Bathyarchaeota archaeon]